MRRRSERVRERGAVAPELPRNGRVYSGQEGVVCASFFGARSGVAHLPLMSGGTGASVIPHGAGHTLSCQVKAVLQNAGAYQRHQDLVMGDPRPLRHSV